MKKQEVGGVPGNVLGMMADLALKLQGGAITPDQFGKFLKKQNPFVPGNYSRLLADWRTFYRDVLGIETDFSGLAIPDRPAGFDRLLVLAQGITPQSAYDLCAKNFPCWKYTDENFDKIVTSDRTAKDGAYAIWVRDRVEADEELKSRSANDLKQQNIPGITLEEREIFELKFFRETGQHLDVNNWTLCSGSRCGGGSVPRVSWSDGGFRVFWFSPVGAIDRLRSRQAVS